MAADYGFVGAVVGFVLSLIQLVVLMGIAYRIDNSERSSGRMGCTCLLRMLALLGLTLGMGAGYMLGRWYGG